LAGFVVLAFVGAAAFFGFDAGGAAAGSLTSSVGSGAEIAGVITGSFTDTLIAGSLRLIFHPGQIEAYALNSASAF
jgi:hypothetical protein